MLDAVQPADPPDDRPSSSTRLKDLQSEAENVRLFSRSPHPYHRRSSSLRNVPRPKPSALANSEAPVAEAVKPKEEEVEEEEEEQEEGADTPDDGTAAWNDLRKSSNASSDSGSEADDESFSIAKALPAPPVRPRKGLRSATYDGEDGSASPLYSPAQVDEDAPKYEPEYFGLKREKTTETEEAIAARQKYRKRRRAEVIRRSTEVCLMGCIGAIVAGPIPVRECMRRWYRAELLSYISVIPILSFLYFARIVLFHSNRHGNTTLPANKRIRIPAAFDPATLLYPTLLPVMVTLSIAPSSEHALLANIILGLSAIPTRLLPFGTNSPGYNPVHWLLSMVPLIASEWTAVPSNGHATKPYLLKMPPSESLTPDMLASLFPLHQALLPPLHYLTTTSLLPAELQLFSIAMTNLLLFSRSPQIIILAIALWTGGLGIFITCGHVLRWGVALARIPRWRFRRAGKIVEARQTFLQTVTQKLKKARALDDSMAGTDTDGESESFIHSPLQSLKLDTKGPLVRNGTSNGTLEPQSALTQTSLGPQRLTRPQRSHTLPDLNELPSLVRSSKSSSVRHRHRPNVSKTFLRLSPNEANLRRWTYALYFYLMLVLVFLLPLRSLVSHYALDGQEPIGWAVGYLIEGLPQARTYVNAFDLESWIPIQRFVSYTDLDALPALGIAQHLRIAVLGEANTRLFLGAYCLLIVASGLLIVLTLPDEVEVDTRRKVFHGTMVFMLLPTIFVDPAFISLALSVILAVFLLLDLIRASQLPPLSKPLARFLTPYVDGRDLRGPVVVSHIFLLIGCAIPLWLSLGGMERSGDGSWKRWEVEGRSTSMLAGVVCVGMGDAAASLIGRRFGRRKWPWAGGKSLEGSAAFAAAVLVGLMFGKIWLRLGGWVDLSGPYPGMSQGVDILAEISWATTALVKGTVSGCGASLMEAVLTGGNDNVIVPVALWLIVRGLQM